MVVHVPAKRDCPKSETLVVIRACDAVEVPARDDQREILRHDQAIPGATLTWMNDHISIRTVLRASVHTEVRNRY